MTEITMIADTLLNVLGSPYLVMLLFVGLISCMILASGGGRIILMLILGPFLVTSVTATVSKYIGISGGYTWISIVVFMAMGIIFAGLFWRVTQ